MYVRLRLRLCFVVVLVVMLHACCLANSAMMVRHSLFPFALFDGAAATDVVQALTPSWSCLDLSRSEARLFVTLQLTLPSRCLVVTA